MEAHRAAIIEGEASETDDEDELTVQHVETPTTTVLPEMPPRARVHVDEKLMQNWRLLGADALTVAWRRTQPLQKQIQTMEKSIDQTFTTLQGSAASMHRVGDLLGRLDDSVNSLLEAASLVPTNLKNNVTVMKNSDKMSLWVDKPDTLQGERVHIKATGLKPFVNYKLRMRLKHPYGTHVSFATYKADAAGVIDVPTNKPIRGTYYDADAMGLFQSVYPLEDFAYGGYLRCTPPKPWIYNLYLLDIGENILDVIDIKKHWMHPRLERTEIEVNGVCGTLFKPPGDGPFPVIMDMSGSGGGIHEHKGSMLASEGFVVLCCAFFQYKTLPHQLSDVTVEYFGKAIDYLLSLPYTTDKLGIQGVSFGATLVIILATRFPKVSSVVCINGPHVQNNYINMRENGELLPEAKVDNSQLYFHNGCLLTDRALKYIQETEEHRIPWERAPKTTKFRLVASVDDVCNASIFSTKVLMNGMKEHGLSVEVDFINGGHIMEPPYFPHHEIVYAKFQGFYCGYGGEVVLHGKSQEKTWANTIDFFKRTLGSPPPMPEWDRITDFTHVEPAPAKI